MKKIKYLVIGLAALTSCKKEAKINNSPVTTTSLATTIISQKDPSIANSSGFFLDDWIAKTFKAPAYSDAPQPTAEATVTVNVDYSNVITKVPKYLFGNNTNPYMGQLITEPVLMNNIKNLSPNILRFPGGSISDTYFWNGQIPSDAPDTLLDASGNKYPISYWVGNNTSGWTLSLDNYYTALQQTNSTGIITINYAYARYGRSAHPDQTAAHQAAQWVRYDKGRTKYWEIGNEDAGPWEPGFRIDITQNKDGQPETITGALYGQHFKVFADSMRKAAKEVGTDIKIGAQLNETDPSNSWNAVAKTWEQGYFASAGDYADFYIVHDYFTGSDNENAATILATPTTVTKAIMDYMHAATTKYNVSLKPIALTEWNIFAGGSRQDPSYIAGMHAAMTVGELLKNQFGMASRWDLANGWNNGNDMGMFNAGDEPDGVSKWNPRPAFYYLYYFQKYFGDRMVGSSVTGGNGDVLSYASSFSSGEAGVVIVNKGTASQTVKVNISNFRPGSRYYYYTLTAGTDNGEFSGKVYVNGNGPSGAAGGPANFQDISANSSSLAGGLKLSVPPRAVIYLVAEVKK